VFGLNGLFSASIDGNKYYYGRLNDGQKTVYKKMLSGIESFSKVIKLPMIPMNETSLIFTYVLLDNPLLYYVTSFSQANDLYKSKCAIMPDYKYTRSFVKQNNKVIMEHLQIFDVLRTKSDIEKEIHIHDYCLDNFRYDYTFNDYSNSILGPVFNKSAVCEGIARFVKLALDYLGVKSLVVSGKARNQSQDSPMEMHAWNIVEISGKTCHLDVTFDMSLKNKTNRYDYFNLTDTDIKIDHSIINNVPACTTNGNDYFSMNSLLMRSPAELETHIADSLKKGRRDITVKVLNVRNVENIEDRILKLAQKQFMNIYNSDALIEISGNLNQMVFEINFK